MVLDLDSDNVVYFDNLEGAYIIQSRFKNSKFVMSLHFSTNFEIQNYYPKAPNFKGINSRNNLPKIKVGHT